MHICNFKVFHSLNLTEDGGGGGGGVVHKGGFIKKGVITAFHYIFCSSNALYSANLSFIMFFIFTLC